MLLAILFHARRWCFLPVDTYLVGGMRPSAADPHTLKESGKLLRSEISELVDGQGVAVLSLSVLLHVLLNNGLVVCVNL